MQFRIGACLCLTLLLANAQDTPPLFRATTELVLVDFQGINSKTRTSTASLQPGAVQVFEDGVRQKILYFSHGETPLSIVLLFDLTESDHGILKNLAKGAAEALAHLRTDDEVAVMAYAAHARLVDGFTRDRSRTLAAISKAAEMKSHEPAYFNEALYEAAVELGQSASPLNRRAIIWLTDNLPNVPSEKRYRPHTEVEAMRALQEQSVAVVPILKKNPAALPWAAIEIAFEAPWRKSYPPGDAYKYAEVTGGIAMRLHGGRADEMLAQVIDDLRARYTVGYRPSDPKPPGVFCKLLVKLSPDAGLRPGEWQLIARHGYYRR
jgi:VWFA-related protein